MFTSLSPFKGRDRSKSISYFCLFSFTPRRIIINIAIVIKYLLILFFHPFRPLKGNGFFRILDVKAKSQRTVLLTIYEIFQQQNLLHEDLRSKQYCTITVDNDYYLIKVL